MKGLIVFLIFLASFAEASTCYHFEKNDHAYERICFTFDTPSKLDTKGVATIYKNETSIEAVKVERKYFPTRIVCSGKEHDCRQVKSSLQISSENFNNLNGTHVSFFLWQADMNKCRSGTLSVINRPQFVRTLTAECSRTWWE